MTDILTTAQEFAASGSLAKVQADLTQIDPQYESQESSQFLAKKIDELIAEVNNIKDALSGD